jgi:hypothetical protein
MRPPVTSLVIQTWKDQGRPKPWKQASRRSSSPDSTDSDGAASDERERDHVALPSRAEQNVFQNSVDAPDPGLKSSSTTLLGREPSRSGVLVRSDLRALRYGAHQVMAPSLVRSYSVDSGLSLSVQAKHANIQFLRHRMRNSLHRDGCLHERIPHFYSSSNIHKSRLNGFSHPPVYPKQPPNHRVQLHGGCGLDPRAPERLSRSMSHMEGLVITDLVSSSMPRSRSMDSELTVNGMSSSARHVELTSSADQHVAAVDRASSPGIVCRTLTVRRSLSMDEGLVAALKDFDRRVCLNRQVMKKKGMNCLDSIAESPVSPGTEEQKKVAVVDAS